MAHVETSNAATVVGSAITPTAGALWAVIHMHHGFVEAGANTNPQSFFVQTNLGATGSDESWSTVAQFTVTDATVVTENMTATEPAGETVLAVADVAGFAAGDYIYIEDNTTAADSEWQQVQEVVGSTSIDIMSPGLETGKDSADRIWSDAGTFTMTLDLSGVARWRVLYMNEGGTALNTAIWVRYIEVTDIE